MKTRLLTIICILVSTLAMAQQGTIVKHLTFMEVPICGNPNQFVKQMIKKGFTFKEIVNDRTISMTGEFAGYKDCELYIYTSGTNTVNSVAVGLPYRTTWAEISNDYFKMKDMLTEKYGKADFFSEVFENPDIQEDWKMMYVNSDRCEYQSAFKRDNGQISVAITHTSIRYEDYSNVRIYYIDSPGAQDVGSGRVK